MSDLIPFSSADRSPRTLVYAGSTDCHMHFFDDTTPLYPGATVSHPNATPDDYRKYRAVIGAQRCVIVQPSAYGFDNRVTLAGLAALGNTARGIAVLPTDVTDPELERLHAAGVRGVRFNLIQPGPLSLADAPKLAGRLAEIGWHIQFQMRGPAIEDALSFLQQIPGEIVFDHMGRVSSANSSEMAALLRLLDTGRSWVKLSGPYLDPVGPIANYADRTPIARRLTAAAPEHCLWASDWPHATETSKPDDALLFDLLEEWVPDETVRRAVLVDNPARLYGFEPNAGTA